MFNAFEETGINWKADIWQLPRTRHTEGERWVFLNATQINVMEERRSFKTFLNDFGSE